MEYKSGDIVELNINISNSPTPPLEPRTSIFFKKKLDISELAKAAKEFMESTENKVVQPVNNTLTTSQASTHSVEQTTSLLTFKPSEKAFNGLKKATITEDTPQYSLSEVIPAQINDNNIKPLVKLDSQYQSSENQSIPNINQEISLDVLASNLQCLPYNVESRYKTLISQGLSSGKGTIKQAIKASEELTSKKNKQAKKLNINPEDTPAGLMQKWMIEVINEYKNRI